MPKRTKTTVEKYNSEGNLTTRTVTETDRTNRPDAPELTNGICNGIATILNIISNFIPKNDKDKDKQKSQNK